MSDEEKKEEEMEPPTDARVQMMKDMENSLRECQEKYTRLLADSENARKRMLKEREEHAQFAIDRLAAEFLSPLDSFEKALKFAESVSHEVKNWAIGFEMILNQFKQVLSSHGIHEFDSVGRRFDPHMHEALEVFETDEYESGTVLEEYVKGYKKGERIVRVARVKVSRKTSTPATGENLEKEKKDNSKN